MFVESTDPEKQKPERNIGLIILILVATFIGLLILLTLLKVAFFTLSLLLWILFNIVVPIGVLLFLGYLIWQYVEQRKSAKKK